MLVDTTAGLNSKDIFLAPFYLLEMFSSKINLVILIALSIVDLFFVLSIIHFIYCPVYCLCYSSQHLKWIETFHQSCPKTKTIPILVLGQLWWTFLIHFKCWLLYIMYLSFVCLFILLFYPSLVIFIVNCVVCFLVLLLFVLSLIILFIRSFILSVNCSVSRSLWIDVQDQQILYSGLVHILRFSVASNSITLVIFWANLIVEFCTELYNLFA